MHTIRNILLAAMCFLATGITVQHADKHPRGVRAVSITVFTAAGLALLAELVWPIRGVDLIVGAALCLIMEVRTVLSPPAGWPRPYVWALMVGWAMAFLAICLRAGVDIGLVYKSHALIQLDAVIALIGIVLLVVACFGLRHKNKLANGVL